MSKLVIGSSKTNVVPAIVRDVSPKYYIEKEVDQNGRLVSTSADNIIDLTGVSIIGAYSLSFAYYKANGITQVPDFSNITIIQDSGLYHTFDDAYNLTGYVNFENLQYLATAGDNYHFLATFRNTKITGVNFKKLESACGFNSAFYNTKITTLSFPSVKYVYANTFVGTCNSCSLLKSMWFYALTDPNSVGLNSSWNNTLSYCKDVAVHFPMTVQSKLSTFANIQKGLGGTNTSVLFDIVTSLEGANSEIYTRQEKDSTDTATAWINNNVLYYTSGISNDVQGVNEPQVGDTIYSDAACTTAVTTISTIA